MYFMPFKMFHFSLLPIVSSTKWQYDCLDTWSFSPYQTENFKIINSSIFISDGGDSIT